MRQEVVSAESLKRGSCWRGPEIPFTKRKKRGKGGFSRKFFGKSFQVLEKQGRFSTAGENFSFSDRGKLAFLKDAKEEKLLIKGA